MIAPLRVRHRRTFTVLALALPALYVLALRARPDPATMAAQSVMPGTAPQAAVSDAAGALPLPSPLFPGLDIDARLLAAGTVLELSPRVMPRAPDVLVYWQRAGGAEGDGDALPGDAVFLGALAARAARYRLPANNGTVLLYSLGHRTVIARGATP